MCRFQKQLYIIATFIAIITGATTNLDENNYEGNSKIANFGTEQRRQSKETGFDVGFDGSNFGNGCNHNQPGPGQNVLPGFDSSFNGNRPGFSETSGFDSGFDGNRPGFSGSSEYDTTRPGYAQAGNFNSGSVASYPGYDTSFSATQPGATQSVDYNPTFDENKPGSVQSSRPGFILTRPWLIQRYRRQVNYPYYENHHGFVQTVPPGFDNGFDGTRPGFGQYVPPQYDSGFDGTRPGFNGRNSARPRFRESSTFNSRQRRSIDSGFLETREDVQKPHETQDAQSERFFFLNPNKNSLPYFPPQWNNQPNGPYGPNNLGPYRPGPFGPVNPGPYGPVNSVPYAPAGIAPGGGAPGTYWRR